MERKLDYFYDCEFLEDGRTIDLVSIGIVCSDGREYYAVNRNINWERLVSPDFAWVRENVWKHLPTAGPKLLCLDIHHHSVKDKSTIAKEVEGFISGWNGELDRSKVRLWADYSAYDFVALCQLWGRMIDLPVNVPMVTYDLVQFAEHAGLSEDRLPKQDLSTVHHALHDARHNRDVFLSIAESFLPRAIAGF